MGHYRRDTQELKWQMESLHRRYDCARKVLTRNPDLQKLPLRQAQGALAKLWCDYTYSKMSNRMASKTINRENGRRMIDTSGMLRKERFDAYQSGRLSVYMEDVVRRLERLQKTGSEDEEVKTQLLTKRKQEIWDNQYLIHHGKLAENKGSYEAGFILQEILGPRPETPLLDDIASAEELEQLERERMRTDAILSDWQTPPGSPWERDEDTTFDTLSLSWDTEDFVPQDEATVPELSLIHI